MIFAVSRLGATAEMIAEVPANTKTTDDAARKPMSPRNGRPMMPTRAIASAGGCRRSRAAACRPSAHLGARDDSHLLTGALLARTSVTAVCCTVTIMMITTISPDKEGRRLGLRVVPGAQPWPIAPI